jgi:chaperone modulatory protein CbpM
MTEAGKPVMTAETTLLILDEEGTVAFDELLAVSGLARDELVELVEFGVLETAGATGFFSTQALVRARRAARLRDDFGLNASGMALALAYLERIDALERRLRELECQLLGPA